MKLTREAITFARNVMDSQMSETQRLLKEAGYQQGLTAAEIKEEMQLHKKMSVLKKLREERRGRFNKKVEGIRLKLREEKIRISSDLLTGTIEPTQAIERFKTFSKGLLRTYDKACKEFKKHGGTEDREDLE